MARLLFAAFVLSLATTAAAQDVTLTRGLRREPDLGKAMTTLAAVYQSSE